MGIKCKVIFFDVFFLLGEEAAEKQISQRHDHDLTVQRPCGDLVCENKIDRCQRKNGEKIGGYLESTACGVQFRNVPGKVVESLYVHVSSYFSIAPKLSKSTGDTS